MDRNAAPADLVRSLGETVVRFEAAARRVSTEQLVAAPQPDGWSLNEILWHIRAQSDVYGEQISRILDEDTPRWRHVSPRARMKKARYDQLPFAESFAAFKRERSDLLALLDSIAPEAWQRVALVRLPDRESRLTLRERVWGMASHEAIHCAQVEDVAAALSSSR